MIYLQPPENFQPKFYVVACFIEHDGKFLMLLRNPEKTEGNKWGAPAGKRDVGETEVEALVREVWEETGITLSHEQVNRSTPTYDRYPDYDFVFHLFHVLLDEKPQVTIDPQEHQDFCWVSPEEAYQRTLVKDFDQHINVYYP